MAVKKNKMHFTTCIKDRDEYIQKISGCIADIANILAGDIQNPGSDNTPYCYDGFHYCAINELLLVDKQKLEKAIIRLEAELSILKKDMNQ